MDEKTVNITPLFKACQIPTGTLCITETSGMYPYKDRIEDNWAYFTAMGCKRLKKLFEQEQKVIKDIGIVGICSGVEAIAIAHLFASAAKRLVVTDIDDEILEGTIRNLTETSQRFGMEIIPQVGLFCEPMEELDFKLDFIHANIPNLPTAGDEDLSKGDEKGSFAPPDYYEKYNPSHDFIQWALPAQYAYLQSAKKVLKPGGSVIAEVGGRMPFHILEKLFEDCDLKLEELVVGFKRQTEAEINFNGYHRNEAEFGVSFEYYRYGESVVVLEKAGFENPTYKLSGHEVKELLEP